MESNWVLPFAIWSGVFLLVVVRWVNYEKEKNLYHHHPKKGNLQVRHHRSLETTCEEADQYLGEAEKIWGDILEKHPQLSEKQILLTLKPLREGLGGHLDSYGATVDPRYGDDVAYGSIAHELYHCLQEKRLGTCRFLINTLERVPLQIRIQKHYDTAYYYICFPEEMAALVFSAQYSEEARWHLREVRDFARLPRVRETVAVLLKRA